MEPGIFFDIPFEEYKSWNAINASALKAGIVRDGHETMYIPRKTHLYLMGKADDKDTPDRAFGRGVHCYIAEGKAAFESQWKVAGRCSATVKSSGNQCENSGTFLSPDGDWYCGVRGHAPADAVVPPEVLTKDQYERTVQMGEMIASHPCASGINGGQSEVSIVFKLFGVLCKARLDYWRPDFKPQLITDLKKFGNFDLGYFNCQSEIAKKWYHLSAEFYRLGIKMLTGELPNFTWIFQEDKAPFDCLPMAHEPGNVENARAWIAHAIREYVNAVDKNHWPRLWESSIPAKGQIPDWALQRLPKVDEYTANLKQKEFFDESDDSDDDGYAY